jgi:hypothetical protein
MLQNVAKRIAARDFSGLESKMETPSNQYGVLRGISSQTRKASSASSCIN